MTADTAVLHLVRQAVEQAHASGERPPSRATLARLTGATEHRVRQALASLASDDTSQPASAARAINPGGAGEVDVPDIHQPGEDLAADVASPPPAVSSPGEMPSPAPPAQTQPGDEVENSTSTKAAGERDTAALATAGDTAASPSPAGDEVAPFRGAASVAKGIFSPFGQGIRGGEPEHPVASATGTAADLEFHRSAKTFFPAARKRQVGTRECPGAREVI